jgi:hypothetical protein
MDPLKGRAEQISAKTAAVMNMKTMVIRKDDLDWQVILLFTCLTVVLTR